MLSFVPLVVLVLLRWIGDGESFSVRWRSHGLVSARRVPLNSLLYSGDNADEVRGEAKGSVFSSREPRSEAESPKQWIIIAPAAPLSWLRETCSILAMLDEYPPFRTREEGREFQADATSI